MVIKLISLTIVIISFFKTPLQIIHIYDRLKIMKKQSLIVITGPTATGKSSLAVEIAGRFNGEVISADSRQVYTGLNIGSAKITAQEMQGVPHHLLDVAHPNDYFSVADFQKLAQEKIQEITSRGKLPILCGGTGMYISAVVDNLQFPEVSANEQLRAELETLETKELLEKLGALDPERLETIDQNNRVRIIRAIEIAEALGNVPKMELNESLYNTLMIGLELPKEDLQANISERIVLRIPALFDEIKRLLDSGVSPERLDSLGLEYRYGLHYIEGKLKGSEFIETLSVKTWQFAKRQMTWWKKDSRINWFNPISDKQKILQLVQVFSMLK
jgi:tRNA dimethylallyltransferase